MKPQFQQNTGDSPETSLPVYFSEATESPEQRRVWNKMDMYVNASSDTGRTNHSSNEPNVHQLTRQPVSAKSSNSSPYIGKTHNINSVRDPDAFYSPMPISIKSSADKNEGVDTGDAGSYSLGSPFGGQMFSGGASDGINLGGGGGGGGGGGEVIGLTHHYGRDRVNTKKYERIDRIAMKLFPIIFILFNVCYWSYYLLLHETFQDLWYCMLTDNDNKQSDRYLQRCNGGGTNP